ncbi:DUF6234 family protein [Streptomyces sp. NPDC059209]|uniref:DUF6234 family protein n=1 Tax=Streptomyces sp. NPDC059209 TaxID=3346769 RepID=UPI0036ABB9F0
MSDLPTAPPAFDSSAPSVKPSVGRGADVGASCGLVLLELIAVAVIVVVWPFLDQFDLDPATDNESPSLWRYLPALGAVGVLAFAAAVIASRARATVTAVSQGAMAVLVVLGFFAGAALQSHEDEKNLPVPAPTGPVGCRSGGDSGECARYGG